MNSAKRVISGPGWVLLLFFLLEAPAKCFLSGGMVRQEPIFCFDVLVASASIYKASPHCEYIVTQDQGSEHEQFLGPYPQGAYSSVGDLGAPGSF